MTTTTRTIPEPQAMSDYLAGDLIALERWLVESVSNLVEAVRYLERLHRAAPQGEQRGRLDEALLRATTARAYLVGAERVLAQDFAEAGRVAVVGNEARIPF